MAALIGREYEQSVISQCIESDKSEFIAIFGRRRIGKTFLVREFFQNRFFFYFTGVYQVSQAQQLMNFHTAIRRYSKIAFPVAINWFMAFEQVCMWHIRHIKRKLGISGVSTQVYSWRSREAENGAQIDLIIKRNDRITNVCEIKFANKEFTIDKKYDEILRNKKYTFIEESNLRDAVHLTLITTYGIKRNEYWGNIQSEVVLDDLFLAESM
jgi:AAA+ ATPase superfamily predicted ATPase